MSSTKPNNDNEDAKVLDTAACTDAPTNAAQASVRRFRLTIIEGPARAAVWQSATDRCSIGSHHRNDLIIDDPTVSRFHCEILVADDGVHIRDLKSRNRTVIDGIVVMEAILRVGSLIRLGKTVIRFEICAETNRLPLSEETRFGSLTGVSPAIRAVFAMLERAASSDATVVLHGETGTGKSQAAHALHRTSARGEGPFVVVDCGALPPNLLESELFGHEKGSFTGAIDRRLGAFEEASGGTLFPWDKLNCFGATTCSTNSLHRCSTDTSAARVKRRLIQRFEHHPYRLLHHAIDHVRNPQSSLTSACFRNSYSPDIARYVRLG